MQKITCVASTAFLPRRVTLIYARRLVLSDENSPASGAKTIPKSHELQMPIMWLLLSLVTMPQIGSVCAITHLKNNCESWRATLIHATTCCLTRLPNHRRQMCQWSAIVELQTVEAE